MNKNVVCQMITVKDKTFVPFIGADTIEQRVAELAAQISTDYEGKNPLFIGVLNGSFIFAADLFKKVVIPAQITFIKLASYSATESTGTVEEVLGLNIDIANRHIVIVEDIVDTGLTMTELLKTLKEYQPLSVAVATLLHKPEAAKKKVELKYVGFPIDNKFVVGYGLDYDGYGRNLPSIYILSE